MRHYRIKEIESDNNKEFIIQYTVKFLFIIFWKKYNKIPYQKYEDALLETKKVVNNEKDYTIQKKNKTIKYHYIDAFRLNRNVGTKNTVPRKQKDEKSRYNRSTFIPKNIEKKT